MNMPMGSALDAEVAKLSAQGFAVESRTESQAVMVKRRRIGWFWNTVLTLLTGGLWLIYVVYRLVNRGADRVVLTVDPTGRIRRS